jgi:hypothetical protein
LEAQQTKDYSCNTKLGENSDIQNATSEHEKGMNHIVVNGATITTTCFLSRSNSDSTRIEREE